MKATQELLTPKKIKKLEKKGLLKRFPKVAKYAKVPYLKNSDKKTLKAGEYYLGDPHYVTNKFEEKHQTIKNEFIVVGVPFKAYYLENGKEIDIWADSGQLALIPTHYIDKWNKGKFKLKTIRIIKGVKHFESKQDFEVSYKTGENVFDTRTLKIGDLTIFIE